MANSLKKEADHGEAYYRDNYADYQRQNSERKLRHYRDQVTAFLDKAEIGKPAVHDIGCAFGDFLTSLPESWHTFGSDQNAFAIKNTRAPRATLKVGSACRDILFTETFDAVTAFDVLEHIEDLEQAARVIKAQLLPKGYFHFVVPVYDGLTGPIIRRLDRDPTHIHKLARHDWINWCQAHFELIQWHGIFRYYLPVVNYYLHLTTSSFRGHVPAIFVTCRNRVPQ